MSTITIAIKTVVIFLIKATFYGCGLALGFWIMGIITGYADHFLYKIIDRFRSKNTPIPEQKPNQEGQVSLVQNTNGQVTLPETAGTAEPKPSQPPIVT